MGVLISSLVGLCAQTEECSSLFISILAAKSCSQDPAYSSVSGTPSARDCFALGYVSSPTAGGIFSKATWNKWTSILWMCLVKKAPTSPPKSFFLPAGHKERACPYHSPHGSLRTGSAKRASTGDLCCPCESHQRVHTLAHPWTKRTATSRQWRRHKYWTNHFSAVWLYNGAVWSASPD